MTRSDTQTNPRLDRPSDTALRNAKQLVPWSTSDQRGNLNLSKDNAAHRRAHSHFEDMMN